MQRLKWEALDWNYEISTVSHNRLQHEKGKIAGCARNSPRKQHAAEGDWAATPGSWREEARPYVY